MDPTFALYRAQQLDMATLRSLLRKRRSAAIPEPLAERIRHREPRILERDAPELYQTFEQLADHAERELEDAGITLEEPDQGVTERLTSAERLRVTDFAALLCWQGGVLKYLGRIEEGLAAVDAGLAWAGRGGDFRQRAILGRMKGELLWGKNALDGMVTVLRRAVADARQGGHALEQAGGLADLGSVLGLQGKIEESEKAIESGFSLLEHEVDGLDEKRLRALFLMNRAANQEHTGGFAQSIATHRKILRLTSEEQSPDICARVHYSLSQLYFRIEQDEMSLEESIGASRLFEGAGEMTELGFTRIGMAAVHHRLGDLSSALEMTERAESCIGVEGSPLHIEVLIRKGNILCWQENYDEAEQVLQKVVDYCSVQNNPVFGPIARGMLADVAMRREDYKLAERCYTDVIEGYEHSAYEHLRLRLHRTKAVLEQMRLDEAWETLQEIDEGMRTYPYDYVHLLHHKARICELRGDLQEALRIEREAARQERRNVAEKTTKTFQSARVTADIRALEMEVEIEKERRQRVEKELVAAVVEIGDQRQLITSAVEQLRKMIAEKMEQEEGDRQILTPLRSLLKELDTTPSSHALSVVFLQGTDDDFFRRLREQWPELTSKQERLCGLIKAGLNSREVETLLELKPEGLKALRKRLRKALGLVQGENLEKFVAEV